MPTPSQTEFNRRQKEARKRIEAAGAKATAARDAAKAIAGKPKFRLPKVFAVDKPLPPAKIIQDYVYQRYGVERAELIGEARSKGIATARFIAMFLMRSALGFSTTRIGALFGGRDHSTVLHAISMVRRKRDRNPDFALELAGHEYALGKILKDDAGQWGRYVPHWKVADYERLGWMVKQIHAPHSAYSSLMVWLCGCPMVEPVYR